MTQQNQNLPYVYKHLVIVHGIGEQVPNETSLNFMNNFLRALPVGPGYQLEVDNLIGSLKTPVKKADQKEGSHASPGRFEPSFAVFTDASRKSQDAGQQRKIVIGFSEVYWQDITGEFLKEYHGAPPAPIFVWARSINTRLIREGRVFYTVRDAVDNLEAILKIVEKLALIFKQSKAFIDIINHFLGDVQMYTESQEIRQRINARFADVLARVPDAAARASQRFDATFDRPDIYVIAHSEGTVVSYGSLVDAAAAPERPEWFSFVRGLVTLGSPLDKHYSIWRNCFELHRYKGEPLPDKIRWFNYWDVSDPVGYGLSQLQPQPGLDPAKDSDAAKLFTICYDRGFARYLVPGLAHVGYWEDADIHENIIDKVTGIGTTRSDTLVESKWFGHGNIQERAAWVAYFLLRAVTLAAIFYFVCKLCAPLPARHSVQVLDQFPKGWRYFNEAGWLAGALFVAKYLWEMFAGHTGGIAQTARWLRRLVVAVWVLTLVMSPGTTRKAIRWTSPTRPGI